MTTKMKRILSTALVIVLVLGCFPYTAFAEKETAVPLPTATVTPFENENLTFALNFKADTPTPEQLDYYGDWYADFVLTVNKEATFNALDIEDEDVDGYLSGQYDAFGPGWLSVPFDNVTLQPGDSLMIMKYASEEFNNDSLRFTYEAICEVVRNFDCGVFFKEEFLEANPDLIVNLELRIYKPNQEEVNYLIGESYTFRGVSLPTATVTPFEDNNLTFALNFKADTPTPAQLNYYGDWYADFVLTVNKEATFNALDIEDENVDGYLSGQYDAFGPGWLSVPFDNVTLQPGDSLMIMKYASEEFNNSSLRFTYEAICEVVRDFDCGVFFKEEFLEANPDLVVNLELRIYNRANEAENYLIGESYSFRPFEAPKATLTEIENENLTFAVNGKADEPTQRQLNQYKDWYVDFELTVNKDVILNMDGSEDGYLGGHYEWFGPDWAYLPDFPFLLDANKPFKIMESAAELLGKSNFTYQMLYDYEPGFECGLFLSEEFLADNPDFRATLEVKLYNPNDKSESYVISDAYKFRLVEPPKATIKEVENEDLTFAVNFKADKNKVTEQQLDYYKDWYADFVLIVNKDVVLNAEGGQDGYLGGHYEWFGPDWAYLPDFPFLINANKPFKIMESAAELLGNPYFTYEMLHDYAEGFECGLFLEPEFLVENPDFTATLEVRLYNPKDKSDSYTISKTYSFGMDAVNTTTGKTYLAEELQAGLFEAKAGETVALVNDIELTSIMVPANVTLDLNGAKLTTGYFACFGNVVDNSKSNEGLLVVPEGCILMQKNNAQLPVKDGEGYRFIEVLKFNKAYTTKFVFQPLVETNAHDLLEKGKEASGVTINVRVSWKQGETTRSQDFEYKDEIVSGYINSYGQKEAGKYGQMFTLAVTNVDKYEGLTYEVVVKSALGVEITDVYTK